MYNFLKHAHSGLAYLVLVGLLASTIFYFIQSSSKKVLPLKAKTLALITMIIVHIQFVFGIAVYVVSPIIKQAFQDFGTAMGDSTLRLYSIEHPMVMLIVVILVTLAHRIIKNAAVKGRVLSYSAPIGFLVALILALSRIPWDVWFAR